MEKQRPVGKWEAKGDIRFWTETSDGYPVASKPWLSRRTAVTQLSHWHSALCAVEEEKGLLKAQQQILRRTRAPM